MGSSLKQNKNLGTFLTKTKNMDNLLKWWVLSLWKWRFSRDILS